MRLSGANDKHEGALGLVNPAAYATLDAAIIVSPPKVVNPKRPAQLPTISFIL
jgi:hypothetical protein